MPLVFAAIAPHGGIAIAEACAPEERDVALKTRAGMEELGRRFGAARPEAVVVLTPHNSTSQMRSASSWRAASRAGSMAPHPRSSWTAPVTPRWRGQLISYEAPTYFGMLTASFGPS